MGYTKLFSKILASSIWNENDKTRLVWVTMLAMQNERYIVQGSVGGLAHQARVSYQDCQKALDVLSSPDPDDSSKVAEGRRIEPVSGGWLIINGEAYRKAKDEDERRAYHAAYMRRWREKKTCVNTCVNQSDDCDAPLNGVTHVKTIEENRIEQNKEEKSIVASATKPKRFKSRPSDYEELKKHVVEKLGLEENDAAWLWEKWMGNGFRVNGKVMDSWKHTAACWERQRYFPSQKPQQPAFGFR